MRFELKPFNIDVIIIEPSAIATEFGDVFIEPMLKRSGPGPYGQMAQAVAKATRDSFENKICRTNLSLSYGIFIVVAVP